MSDFAMHNDGSIVLLTPQSDEAKEVFEQNFGSDPLMFGGWYVVEQRYLNLILEDLYERGFIMDQE